MNEYNFLNIQNIDFNELEEIFFSEYPQFNSSSTSTDKTDPVLSAEIVRKISLTGMVNFLSWAMEKNFEKINFICGLLRLFSPYLDVNLERNPPLLFRACSFCRWHDITEPFEILLSYPKVNVNIVDMLGRTPLHAAADELCSDLVKILLARPEIKINTKTQYGNTPLHLIIEQNPSWSNIERREKIIEMLLNHPDIDINLTNNFGQTPFYLACGIFDDIKSVKLFLNMPNIQINPFPKANTYFPLVTALLHNKVETVKLLLSHPEIDVNAIFRLPEKNLRSLMSHWPDGIRILLAFSGIFPNGIIPENIIKLLEEQHVGFMSGTQIPPPHSATSSFSYIQQYFKKDESWGESFALAQKLRIAPTFALIVYLSDDYLRLKNSSEITTEGMKDFRRFFTIATQLPMELQMVLSHRCFASAKNNISSKDAEKALASLALTFGQSISSPPQLIFRISVVQTSKGFYEL